MTRLLLALATFIATLAAESPLSARASSIADGDTITVLHAGVPERIVILPDGRVLNHELVRAREVREQRAVRQRLEHGARGEVGALG